MCREYYYCVHAYIHTYIHTYVIIITYYYSVVVSVMVFMTSADNAYHYHGHTCWYSVVPVMIFIVCAACT